MVVRGKRKALNSDTEAQLASITVSSYARIPVKPPPPRYYVSWYNYENEVWLELEVVEGASVFSVSPDSPPTLIPMRGKIFSSRVRHGKKMDCIRKIDAFSGLVCDGEARYIVTSSFYLAKLYSSVACDLSEMPAVFAELYSIKLPLEVIKSAYSRYMRS